MSVLVEGFIDGGVTCTVDLTNINIDLSLNGDLE